MMIGSTPTHKFALPFDLTDIKELLISYEQGNNIIVRKNKSDCTIDGNTIITNLTQEETLKFNYNEIVRIQIKVKNVSGNVDVSNIINVSPQRCLDKEVI